jgi:thymidine kinase
MNWSGGIFVDDQPPVQIEDKMYYHTFLIVIAGSMGSGKTTEAFMIAHIAARKMTVLCVGSTRDIDRQNKRREKKKKMETSTATTTTSFSIGSHEKLSKSGSHIETHDSARLPAILCLNLSEIYETSGYKEANCIVIDEGHFFKDLVPFIETARNDHGKNIIVATLDADRYMKPFVDLDYLVTHATFFQKFSGICTFCNSPSSHTIAIKDVSTEKSEKEETGKKEEEKDARIHPGGMDIYTPVCYFHAIIPKEALPPFPSIKNGIILKPT